MIRSLDASLLVGLPTFSGLRRDELVDLLKQATSHRYEKGEHIFEQGDESHSFFLLLDGCIRVVKVTPHGEQIIARFISGGELFGIAPAIGLKNYPAAAVAAVDCVTLSWPSPSWPEIVDKHPTFATNTYSVVGERLQETQDRIVELTTERAAQRVANAVLKLTSQTGRKTEEGVLIDFPISRQDISEMTGTTLHTVSRLLSSWEQNGFVRSGRQKITVMDGEQLLQIAHGKN